MHYSRRKSLIIFGSIAFLILVALGVYRFNAMKQESKASFLTGSSANAVTVRAMLDQLQVATEHTSDYSEDFGGRGWQQRDKCSTKDLVLQSEAIGNYETAPDSCKPVTGQWYSPYDGKSWTNSSALQIDHLVPKEEAWQSGAYAWTDAQRKAFKNDLGYGPSLIAVTSHENQSKQSQEPGNESEQYLPPIAAYQCEYVAEWIAVKYRWSLNVDSQEKKNLLTLLDSCGESVKISIPSKVEFE